MTKKKLFIVDDEFLFLQILGKTLTEAGYDVTLCEEATGAKHIYSLQKFDLVITDLKISGDTTGIDLLRYFKSLRDTPVILMTGFSELLETKKADELGADGFLSKPFQQEDLLSIVKEVLSVAAANTPVELPDLDEQYCKVPIEDFVTGKSIEYDIYIRLSAKKYVKIANERESLPVNQLESYQEKGIEFLHLKKEDFKKYIGFNLNLLPLVSKSDQISKEKKLAFMKHTGEVIMEHIFNNDVDRESFQNAKDIVQGMVSTMADHKDTYHLLNSLNQHTDHLYAHSTGVSLYSAMLCKEMRWNSSASIMKASVSGLLHDIGKKEIDSEILSKPRKEMSPMEIKIYESHPLRGVEILTQIQGVSGEIIQIIGQHHENCLGLGYPSRLSKAKIHPIARLVSVANEFCRWSIKNPNSDGLPPHEAIRQILMFSERFDKTVLSALMRLFRYPIPADF